MTPDEEEVALISALRAIIEGNDVKRSVHSLAYGGKDLTGLFLAELSSLGYTQTRVRDVPVVPGERVPAFYLREGTAYFGWVFWEQFTSRKMRKLWGSVAKNHKGDWAVEISEKAVTPICANVHCKIEMDIDHPPGF